MIAEVAWREVRWPIAPRGAARELRERRAVIVAVKDATGAIGLGEAAPLPGLSRDTIADAVAAMRALATLEVVTPAITDAPAARFAIETALAVVAARPSARRARPLRTAIVVDDADGARAARSGCLKIKLGAGDDVARVAAIARAAPDAELRLDANRAWPPREAAARIAELAAVARIAFVEEPCRDAHRLLDAPLAAPLALDESLGELAPGELARALASPQLAALVLKPTLLGGAARCLELAAAARAAGVAAIASHALEGPIGFAACAELARAIDADVAVGLGHHPALDGWRDARWR
ncbi:MAG TPA: enolase C-terminal domain-like protein [Kofleriaceae bacterium]|nr:enolase C-terminal domain-like protein [Kofleriaceae bacterium]